MRADVAERAAAGLGLVQTPRQGRVLVRDPVLEVLRAHVPHGADAAVGHELARELDRRHAAVGEAHHRDLPAPRGGLGGRDHLLGLGDRVRERLLAEHVLAGLERGDRDLGVGVAGRAHVDEVDVVPADERLPARLRGLPAEPLRGGGDRLRVAAAEDPHPRVEGEVEEPGGGPPGLRVRCPHERVPDHADAELRAVVSCHDVPSVLLTAHAHGPAGRYPGGPWAWSACFLLRADGCQRVRQDWNAVGRYWSTLSFVTTGAKSWTVRGTSDDARSLRFFSCATRRASLMPSAACVDG